MQLTLFNIFVGPIDPFEKSKPKALPPVDKPDIIGATIGKRIPVLFGTRLITDINICWYGDLRTVPVKAQTGGKKK